MQLNLHGYDAIGESASTAVDTALLMDVMEKREQLEDASSRAEVLALKEDNNVKVSRLLVQLTACFKRNDLENARRRTIELQYYTRLNAELDERLLRFELQTRQ